MDINSIIEMINNTVRPIEKVHSPYRVGYDDACDDIIEQLRKMSDWQPIETAPKEGEFLVYLPNERKKYQVANYHPNINVIGHVFAFDLTEPTHWMPLPKQPSKAL